jgi:hypothetical protein
MSKFSRLIPTVSAALAVLLAGCGSDGIGLGVNAGDELSDAEIQALFNELGTAIGSIGGSAQHVTSGQDGPQLAPISVKQSVNETASCQSGTIGIDGDIDGTVDDETFESDLSLLLTLDFNDCAVPTETQTITLNGPPGLQYDIDFVIGQEEFSVSGTMKGGFSFSTDDQRDGSCAIDLEFSASYSSTGSSQTSTVTGAVCGRSGTGFEPYTGGV